MGMSAPSDWERVRLLFHKALAVPPEERAAFVRSACTDERVQSEVESLLAAHEAAGGFLSASPGGFTGSAQGTRLEPGTRLGAFEILGPLGAGGMGEVFRARDTRLDREVAIKVLSRDLAADHRGRERFEREARAVSRLTHPHICTLYDIGSALVDGVELQFLVMELLDGETLADRLRRGPLPVESAKQMAAETLDALSAAHAVGIIHRDLKPANIMLTRSGVKLLDFGLARLREPPTGTSSAADPATDPLTMPGLIFGTLPYMAPEQVRGEEADARADLFAFGAVFYEMLTGRRAFSAESEPSLIAEILERDPPSMTAHAPSQAAPLEPVLKACLAKDPANRWQHARDVALALEAIGAGNAMPAVRGTSSPTGEPRRHWPFIRSWRLHASWAAVATGLAVTVWLLGASADRPLSASNSQPVVVLMDSPLEGRVYDPRTLSAGGTNADDITDALRGLAIVTHKENTSPMWHREQEVVAQNPDLIISHLSALFDQRVASDPKIRQHLFDMSQARLVGFFGYVATVNTRTKFLVYSRGRFGAPAVDWSRDVLVRFPQMQERLFTLTVPGGEKASFRDPATVQLLRDQVAKILGLQ